MVKNISQINEAKKRFQQILEYTYYSNPSMEEDDQQDGGQGDMGDMSQGAPDDMGGIPQGGDPNAMGDMPQGAPDDMGGAQQGGPAGFNPQDGAMNDMGGEPNAMGDMPQGAPDDMGGMPTDGGLQPDDEVIDISELTDSQEETEKDIEKMDKKFGEVMKHLGKFEELIRSNDEKIEKLQAELEKRNPTQIEKLSMQTGKSYPFNVTPEEYWKEKEATSNYRVEDDNNGKQQAQYVITKDDVDGNVDWKSISDSLDDIDIMHQTLKNTMGFGI